MPTALAIFLGPSPDLGWIPSGRAVLTAVPTTGTPRSPCVWRRSLENRERRVALGARPSNRHGLLVGRLRRLKTLTISKIVARGARLLGARLVLLGRAPRPIATASRPSGPVWRFSMSGSTRVRYVRPPRFPHQTPAAANTRSSAWTPHSRTSFRRRNLLPEKLDSTTRNSAVQDS
jgi:hypothetical protein